MKDDAARLAVPNRRYAERLYARHARDPLSVPSSWRRAFEASDRAALDRGETNQAPAPQKSAPGVRRSDGGDARQALLEERADRLAEAFVALGHRAARIDPLQSPRPEPFELDPRAHGIRADDLEGALLYDAGRGPRRRTVRSLVRHLRASWCGAIGAEVAHLTDPDARAWLRARVEAPPADERLDDGGRVELYRRLVEAAALEELLRKKRPGTKSYSIAGSESLLPLLDAIVANAGVVDLVLAMQHRGRLNVLVNLLGLAPRELFASDVRERAPGEAGDVPFHQGASHDVELADGRRVHVSLCFNPSHLESVNPVALGRVRARQDRAQDRARERSVAVLLHGDAALSGTGAAQETLNLAELEAYDTGGVVHVVVDNAIGFTTPPSQGRATAHASDLALAFDLPVLHVNGNDAEAVVRAARIACAYRRRFRRSVFVDLKCVRRFGHSEVDEPRFTQPLLYARIDETPNVLDAYRERLVLEGVLDARASEAIAKRARARHERGFDAGERPRAPRPRGVWEGFSGGAAARRGNVSTASGAGRLRRALLAAARLPAGFRPHDKIARLCERRCEIARGERRFDWATAEIAALATLALEGVPVRLTGQDSERGTFGQRHAVVHDQVTGERYAALAHLARTQAPVEVANSPLSELAALGFEYGYSLDRPDALVVWEAQFGDFANAAQVVIDQFLVAAEDKWRRLSGLVLLLPHGYEGSGPEHSNARLGRLLAACAEDNVQVAQPTTPAQHFHLLRRQALVRWRKPLFVLTPKSLLRDARCTSDFTELARGAFEPVLAPEDLGEARRVLLCSGKVAYDLEERREDEGRDDVAVVRLEELYPFPRRALARVLARVRRDAAVRWVQDEPLNMGAWSALRARFGERLQGRAFSVAARPPSASPATGWTDVHEAEREALLEQAFEEER